MILSDGIVRLRPWRPEDASAIADAAADPHITCWSSIEEGVEAWLARQHRPEIVSLAITLEGDDRPRGQIHLRHSDGEIGYWVLRAHRGHGLATRALRLVAAWSRATLGRPHVVLEVEAGNEPSLRVAEAAGARLTGERVREVDRAGVERELLRLRL